MGARVIMNFVTGFSLTPRKKKAIWVIADRVMKSAHFIPIQLYVSEITKLHGVPLSINSDHDMWFTSRFMGKLHEALGTKHLKICSDVVYFEFESSWAKIIPLVEFASNNGYQSNIKMEMNSDNGEEFAHPVLQEVVCERFSRGLLLAPRSGILGVFSKVLTLVLEELCSRD
ncbi:Gag protease polyprotein [Gossypium australe]|uniref:Gag protease polyprotein n=1 Tax=Gossypium australe TaxID=47621 RepID=A0A5B6WMQ9_9ROSI|nr:Gag protease polyprotein [Gossypium australe]